MNDRRLTADAGKILVGYKKAWEVEQARNFLREGYGTHFDPKCVDAFLNNWNHALTIKARFADPEWPVADPLS